MHIMAREGVLCVKLDQSQEYFTYATEDGLRIFHVDPLVQIHNVDASKIGSIRIAEMRCRCNIVALVSGGSRPLYDDRTVILWDLQKEIAHYKITVKEPVLDVKMTNDRLLVILRSRIIAFSFPSGETLSEMITGDNPNAVCAIAHHARKIVFPARKNRGSIQIEDLDKDDSAPQSKPPVILQAHSNDIICAAINFTGDCIATASTQGTNIHLHFVHNNEMTKLRRGLDKANIYCLNFSKDSSYLSCSSDKGTVHIWSLKDPQMNPVSRLSEVKSFASFTVTAESMCLCLFGVDYAIYAICLDGSYHKYRLGKDYTNSDTGKNCNRIGYDIFPILGELYD